MKENYIESSLNDKQITTKIVEQKLLDTFQFLNDKQQIHNIFSSYDFRPGEENMVNIWEKILKYLFLNIFSTFGMKISEIKTYTIIGNYVPVGLMNIIQELRIKKKLITDSDINNKIFYVKNFPEVYSNDDSSSQGWGSYIMSGVKNLVNFGGSKLGCAENKEDVEEKNNQERRQDISDEDKYISLPDNTIIFNYELFRNNSNELLSFLSDVLQESDNEVIEKNAFIKEVNKASSDSNEGLYNVNLHFGSIYIDYCLNYLDKLKKISIFTVDDNNRKIYFIKLMINKNDFPKEKDIVFAKIILKCDTLQLKINDIENKIQTCLNNARNCLKKGNKNGAKPWLAKKNVYEKHKQIFNNTHLTLINQMMDIKNAESNVKATEILKTCNNLYNKIGADKEEFLEISEDLKEQKELENEISSGLKEFADNNDEELDEELKKLEEEGNKNNDGKGDQNLVFPSALNQPLNPFSSESQELYKQK